MSTSNCSRPTAPTIGTGPVIEGANSSRMVPSSAR